MAPPLYILAAADPQCVKSFLGLVPWYKYLDVKYIGPNNPNNCDITNFNLLPTNGNATDVPLVLAAIADDLLRIAGMVAIAFVIVGAIQYITSQGNPEGTAKAQGTIINALIGVAIATVAVTFVSFIGTQLGT
jgi:hypothetical protein